MEIIVLFLVLFILVFLIIWPAILFFMGLFDGRVSIFHKILLIVATIIGFFPFASFCYGSFVRKGGFSTAMVWLLGVIYSFLAIATLVNILFFGGWESTKQAVLEGYNKYSNPQAYRESIQMLLKGEVPTPAQVEQTFEDPSPATLQNEAAQPETPKENTYRLYEPNVFQSGKKAEEKPAAPATPPAAPEPAPAPAPAQQPAQQ